MSREIENMERLMNNKGVQFRDFTIEGVEIRAAEEDTPERLIIRGVPCVFESDTILYSYRGWDGMRHEVHEQVASEAFDDTDMTDVIFNYNHAGRVFARTRNESLRLKINKSRGLEMEAELWDDDEGHRQLYRDIKRGNIDKMSFAFNVTKFDERKEVDEDESTVRHFYTIRSIGRLFDVSAVDIPAYNATEISARRLFDAESEEHEAESRKAASLARARYNYEKERSNL